MLRGGNSVLHCQGKINVKWTDKELCECEFGHSGNNVLTIHISECYICAIIKIAKEK